MREGAKGSERRSEKNGACCERTSSAVLSLRSTTSACVYPCARSVLKVGPIEMSMMPSSALSLCACVMISGGMLRFGQSRITMMPSSALFLFVCDLTSGGMLEVGSRKVSMMPS